MRCASARTVRSRATPIQADAAEWSVPREILARPPRGELRDLERDECALLLDRYLRVLGRQEALCRRVLGRLAGAFLRVKGHHRLGFSRLGDCGGQDGLHRDEENTKVYRVSRASPITNATDVYS